MGMIKEPLDVDFTVESRPLTEKEKIAISEYIRADKKRKEIDELQRNRSAKRLKKRVPEKLV